jgi:hypothetical protein
MDTSYADACLQLEEEVSFAVARAREGGLTNKEAADELRRIANEIEQGS